MRFLILLAALASLGLVACSVSPQEQDRRVQVAATAIERVDRLEAQTYDAWIDAEEAKLKLDNGPGTRLILRLQEADHQSQIGNIRVGQTIREEAVAEYQRSPLFALAQELRSKHAELEIALQAAKDESYEAQDAVDEAGAWDLLQAELKRRELTADN